MYTLDAAAAEIVDINSACGMRTFAQLSDDAVIIIIGGWHTLCVVKGRIEWMMHRQT